MDSIRKKRTARCKRKFVEIARFLNLLIEQGDSKYDTLNWY